MADPKFIDAVLLGATSPPGAVVLNARVALLVPRMIKLLEEATNPGSVSDHDARWTQDGPSSEWMEDVDRLLAEIDAAKAGGG